MDKFPFQTLKRINQLEQFRLQQVTEMALGTLDFQVQTKVMEVVHLL